MLPFRLWPILKIVMWVGSATTTLAQSVLPTQSPSAAPTLTPTSTDSRIPTSLPTSTGPPSTGGLSTSSVPVPLPTMMGNVPTYPQTAQPTFIARPSAVPTGIPTSVPTAVPSQPPTVYNPNMTIFPTDTPSSAPTSLPSPTPTRLPTLSVEPTRRPTDSKEPSFVPTSLPSSVPTFTFFPTKVPVETESPTEYSSLPPTTSVPSSSPTNASFLCQGFSCNGPNGALGCPDYTVQSRQHSGSAGGNVFVTVIAAQNLEDRDGTTVPDGGVARSSDPYVRVRVGTEGHWSTKETQRVGNDENPRWSETLSMGWHRAGEARMRFEVLDYDTGLEVIDGDDSLGTASLWLPFCSTLTAGFDELDCDKEVCAAHDSSWAMSHRQLCREEGWLLLNDGYYTTVGTQACCETNAACLRIVVEIVPFQLYVDDIHASNSNPDESFATSLFVDPAIESAGELPTAGFGQPYVDKSIYTVNGESSQIDAAGALLLQTTAEDGRFNQLLSDDDATDSSFRHARLSVNARTTLTICRLASCYPVPSWLHEWDYYVSIPVLKEARYQGFACYQRIAGPTKRNKYGTVEENSVDLGWAQCEKNYFVVAEPHFGAPSRAHIWQLHFERIKFAVKVVQLGIPLLIVLPGTVTLLRLCEFRLDRLDGYLFSLGRDVAAEGWRAASKLPATLFLGDGASTNNRELRHNHYWATRCVLFLLTIPCAVFWTAGVIIASTVQPVNAGLGILLVGTAILGILGALSRWRLDGWRLTSVSCSALIASVGCILIFSIAAVLLDPKLTGNEKSPPVDFIALTVALLTAGLVPLAVEATEFNALVHAAKGALATALAGAAADIQKEFPDDEDGDYWLMKECYSACSDSPHFDFVSDIAGDLCGLSNRINSAQVAAARRALLLAGSRSVLVAYIMSAFLLTSKGPLALAIAIFLSITDVIHTCLGRGSVFWSPTKTVLLMAAARALIVFGGATFWVVGLSAAHSIYGYVLTLEIVNKYLPYLEQLEACGIVFLARGGTTRRTLISSHFDVAGTPEFVLMVLTATLFSIVLFAGYATPTGLPLPYLMLSSRVQIPTYTFAVMSLLFVAFCGTARGFVRASHLGSQNLLGGADTAYLFFPWLTLPKMLAGLAYICLVTAGLLLWGASDTPSALAACALGPISVLCLLRAGSAWLANDCRLVVWPPHIIHAIEGDNVSESELAFGMLQAMMGSGSSQRPDAKTLGSLDLPQLLRTREDDTEAIAAINMPMLPPKSTMKKRAEATIVSSISQATAQHAAPVVPGETTARPHVLRRQVINLGLHNVRINKLKRILASPPKEGDDERARKRKRRGLLPSLTLKEVFVHLNGLVWQHICSQFASAKAKVADEVSSEQPHTEAIAPVALDSSVDPAWLHVPMWEAVVTGCLLPEEYTTLLCACSAPILYVLLGWFLAIFSHPHFAGHLLWAVGTAVFCTIYPIVKWFKVYKVTNDMTYTGVFGWVVYVGILAWAFYSWLDARYDIVETLLIVDALILYPVCLNELYRLLVWIDDGCQDQNPSVRATADFTREAGEANVELDASDVGHGRVDKPKIQMRICTPRVACRCPLPTWLARPWMYFALLAQIYLWGSRYAALICSLFLLGFHIASYFIRSWAKNDFYLPPKLLRTSDLWILYCSFATITVFLTVPTAPPATTISVFFLLQLFQRIIKIVNLCISVDPGAVFWFARTLLPTYSYSTRQNLLLDQTALVIRFGTLMGVGVCWGVTLVCFAQPVSLGVILISVFVSTSVVLVLAACSQIPEKLGTAAAYLSTRIFNDAAAAARHEFINAFEAETSRFEAKCDEWDQGDRNGEDDIDWEEQVALEDTHGVDGALYQSGLLQKGQKSPTQETVKLGPSALALATEIYAAEQALRLVSLKDGGPIWRADALYTDLDGIAETCASRGPFGCLGLLACFCKLGPMHRPLRHFDEEGRRVLAQETVEFEAVQAVLHLPELDRMFRRRFDYELKALARFHLLVLSAADAHLTYEKAQFEKFVRENRFKLLSNGVAPPRGFVEAASSAALNMRLVASWLESLDEDQRERFHLLQENFKAEQRDYETDVDQRDRGEVQAAIKLTLERLERERVMFDRRASDCTARRSKRTQRWVASLTLDERDRFITGLQKLWEGKPDCHVQPADEQLRASYEFHVLLNNDETVGNCRERLSELEAGELDCYPSKSRKGALQFIDPDFQPGLVALGSCAGSDFVGAWNHALSVNPHAVLFADGSDPDDVHPGECVEDGWLLSALSMLSAAGGIGDGDIDIQIRRLFINMVDLEGNIVYDSAVGAFGLQFYVNGQWEATVVDDSLPMLGDGTLKGAIEALAALDAYKHDERPPVTGPEQDGDERPKVDITTVLDASTIEAYQQRHKDCAGFAVSHATEMGELWVSLLEKGVAKYYGSYANIEVGFVHHGLELLTGNRSECFHIAEAARGVGKRALWGSLLRYYENEYILGAGAVTAEHASPSLKDLGLLFGATYTIYEVIDVMPEGLKLIKLRNPPGHAQSFKGSWSQKSHRWTERLRHKFIHNLDPQTFWMSFDEFCCAFRCLFICHYYTDESARWRRLAVSGEWTCGQSHVQDDVVEPPANERENTAAGLPSSHNPGCEVERNPQYAIVVHRPITLRMSISQTDAKGRANATVLPIAAYLCRADNRSSIDIDRVTKLGNHNIVTTTGPVRRTRSVDAYVDNLDPGIYILLIGAFQAEMEGHFTATIISNYAVDVTQIWPPTWREAPSEALPKITGKA